MKSKIIINGAAGRMGKGVIRAAAKSDKLDVFAAVDHSACPYLGKDAGAMSGIENLLVEVTSQLPAGGDVVVDFSLPQAANSIIEYCIVNKCALVMCTTGLSDEHMAKLEKAAKTIPLIQATNMSIGMNLLFEIVGQVAEKLGPEYDIEICETHHRFKKDAPSGTALTLAERIAEKTGKDYPGCLDVSRKGKEALRVKNSIGMQAIRMGNVVGEHSIMFGSLEETVTLSHNAITRDVFATGAIRAAEWIIGKAPQKYSMADVLGLR